MFSKALKPAYHYTRPIVISQARVDGQCLAGVGTCVVVNKEGWIVTAAHVIVKMMEVGAAVDKHGKRVEQEQQIRTSSMSKKEQSRALRKIGKPSSSDLRDFSVWLGQDGVKLVDISGRKDSDLAIGRLEPFDPSSIKEYPRFKDFGTDQPQPGTSLCTLGYAFDRLKAAYDEQAGRFTLDVVGRLALFPIEGIMTRVVNDDDGKPLFIERSSPGLMGQSGGPILDKDGAVWSIQSKTMPFSLGFDPKTPKEGKVVHQFLNVGWGVHPERIREMLDENKISYDLL